MIRRIRRRTRLLIIFLIAGSVPAAAFFVKISGQKPAKVNIVYIEAPGCESYPAMEEEFAMPEEINDDLIKIRNDHSSDGLFNVVPVLKNEPVRLSTLQH
jgi:hypothetical protein